MLKRIAKWLAGALIALVVICTAGYLAGLRIVIDGGGTPSLSFVESADDRAAALARHREAQRAQAPPPATSLFA